MVARPIPAPLAFGAALALSAALAHASPRTDPTAGRAVFTGATLPNATSVGLNPAALGIGPFGEVLLALTSTLDQIRIDQQELDLEQGTLSPGSRVRATELSPGAMVGLVVRTGRYTLGAQAQSPPSEQFVSGYRTLRYHTTGGWQREYVGTIAGSIRVTSKFFVGAHIAHSNTFLRLRYTRDTALAEGGAPGGPDRDEDYDVGVRSPYIGGGNLKVTVGLAAKVYRNVWVGVAYHTPPGFAIQSELQGDVDVTLSPSAGGERVRGRSTVYVQYPASVDAEVRAELTNQLELHVGGRWEDLSRMQAYDVRAYNSTFVDRGVPEWTLRPRGLHDSFALWSGIESADLGQVVRYGARVGYETSSVDDAALSPVTIAPQSFTLDAGGELRLGRSSWAVQLSYGLQLFPPVTVTRSDFDPRFQIECVESGHDYESRGCAGSRAGYAIATAAGTYGRFQHALRLGLRYEIP
jgi:hypothetical protein